MFSDDQHFSFKQKNTVHYYAWSELARFFSRRKVFALITLLLNTAFSAYLLAVPSYGTHYSLKAVESAHCKSEAARLTRSICSWKCSETVDYFHYLSEILFGYGSLHKQGRFSIFESASPNPFRQSSQEKFHPSWTRKDHVIVLWPAVD